MFRTLHRLKQLSPSQQAAVAHKQLSGTYTVRALLEELRALSEFDRQADAARSSARRGLIVAGIAFVATLWLSFPVGPKLLPLPGVLLVALLYFGIALHRLGPVDLSNNVRQVALPFLVILKQDMDPEDSLDVRLDLALPTVESKFVKRNEPYRRGPYKVVDTFFRDAWFEGSARLADGTVVRWRVVDEICESQRTKRNPRGKYKTKVRHRKSSYIGVAVSLPLKAYHVDAAKLPSGSDHKVTIQHGERRATIKLASKRKTKSLEPMHPNMLLDAVSHAYRCATPVRGAVA